MTPEERAMECPHNEVDGRKVKLICSECMKKAIKEKLLQQMRKVKDAIFLCTIGASNNIDRKRLLNELSKT